jgi:Spy/CpxP family protein refolding chaperone
VRLTKHPAVPRWHGGLKNKQKVQQNLMKSTKPLLIAALVAGSLFACNTALLAQDSTNTPPPAGAPPAQRPLGGMRGGMRGPTIEQLTTNLDLTADQIPKVTAVLDDQKKKMADLMADDSVQGQDRRTKMMDIRTEETAKMKEILTDDQFAKYQKMTQRGRRGGAGGGGGNPPPATAPPQN